MEMQLPAQANVSMRLMIALIQVSVTHHLRNISTRFPALMKLLIIILVQKESHRNNHRVLNHPINPPEKLNRLGDQLKQMSKFSCILFVKMHGRLG